mmetsp:Transcript_25889/g.37105  ORF Transcript_25889/g.37105 Transcript_25889/m.37105 type:complete len:236 (+) Transcript_25889:74-781(+)|eukprot:CAMPEP_0172419062 /NCGR_PEP_ID=MMETSP1064-20121228/5505_1 /TAXON_ID=202472 /ORGANISM="Aulacoseira subarctica , Strain CCAP 1002/5" /LENGTH=235 /DNA_ID=CAMNT_0013158329 /DNA_START=619 /DNA_END=1326 /DNA_ORIENTATION=+
MIQRNPSSTDLSSQHHSPTDVTPSNPTAVKSVPLPYSAPFAELISRVSPAFILLSSSIPLLAGTYVGYRRVVRRGDVVAHDALFEKIIGNKYSSTSISNNVSQSTSVKRVAAISPNKVEPVSIAIKALSLGSMLSIGGVGLISAGVFLLSGCRSMQELVESCKIWTPRMRMKVESYLGIPTALERYAQDDDIKAVAGLNEEEELEFYGRKYIPELYEKNDVISDEKPSSTSNKNK